MFYPQFLKDNDVIGICAPSAGVGHKIDSFQKSLAVLKSSGFKIWETEHVRVNGLRGGTSAERAEELMSLFALPSVSAVFCATGGDFLSEILPLIDWSILYENPKWLIGYSDPTNLLFPLTLMGDVATIYGHNAGSFDSVVLENGTEVLPDYLQCAIRILKGENVIQRSYPFHLGGKPFEQEEGPLVFDAPTVYRASVDQLQVSGRCIGGCIDVLKDLIGTEFDLVPSFLRRYEKDGFIWYFDNFALSSAVLYRTFLQMRYAGWIDPDTTRAILLGRTLFENEEAQMTYEEAVRLAFPDIPVIWNADIGHTDPRFTMINGAMLDLNYENGSAELHFRLE